ncbi:MAG TPA: tannase/feruloyl esterase family alpha/beta hydrolase [Reyranella sp.]|nr:tannase/feruloyl esterase family alpha/beta hydrolase [Reyranella sp.]
MGTYLRSFSVSAAVVLLAAPAAWAQSEGADKRCAALTSLSLPGAKVVSAESMRSGAFHEDTDIDGKPYDHRGLPAFCRVRGEATPTPDSHIGFEVWLPFTGWDGRLHMVGNGAYSDRIYYGQMAARLRSGDVAVATDTGHKGGDLSFGDGHPERIADWGHRAVHESAVAGKAVATGFYGYGPRVSYFSGCSTGGHQALQEAQRYPNDFDGIIAGDPGNNRTNLNLTFLSHFLKNHRKGDNAHEIVPAEKLRLVKRSVVAACDALDGVSDGVVNDPRQCKFDVASLTCKAGDDASCLTPPQVEAVKAMYQAPRDARTGQPLYADFLPGSEGSMRTARDKLPGWSAYWANPRKPEEPQRVEYFRQWAFGDPKWDWWSFDWGKDIDLVRQKVSPMVDATSTDLSAFRARGGKLIVFMGWDDPVGAAMDIVGWFEKLQPQDFAKLYMVPGMWHCAEGTGATNFSTATRDSVPPVSDAHHDMAIALQDWVENKEVPQEIVATRFEGPDAREGKGPIAFQRPLCSWPLIAKYNGGPTEKAESFSCRLPDAK